MNKNFSPFFLSVGSPRTLYYIMYYTTYKQLCRMISSRDKFIKLTSFPFKTRQYDFPFKLYDDNFLQISVRQKNWWWHFVTEIMRRFKKINTNFVLSTVLMIQTKICIHFIFLIKSLRELSDRYGSTILCFPSAHSNNKHRYSKNATKNM